MQESLSMKLENNLPKTLFKSIRSSVPAIVGASCALWLSSCVYTPSLTKVVPKASGGTGQVGQRTSDLRAAKFNKDFAAAVTAADKVVVREHSHSSDISNLLNSPRSAPKYTYVQKSLNFNERMTFVSELNKLNGRAKTITAECLFVPHHSVELYKGGKLTSVMGICYTCGEIQWNGSSVPASGDMFDAVTPLLKRSGMKVHRNWQSKAQAKLAEGASGITRNPDGNTETTVAPKTPTAKWIPGQVGKKVLNPYTGTPVDVDGIPSGVKVRDPNDSNTKHVFRVPAQ